MRIQRIEKAESLSADLFVILFFGFDLREVGLLSSFQIDQKKYSRFFNFIQNFSFLKVLGFKIFENSPSVPRARP